MKRTLSGVVEISTAALTVTNQPPVFVGENGALEVSLSFLMDGAAADISSYVAEMYLFWPERKEMTDAVEMTVSTSAAVGTFSEELTALAGAPLFIVQLTDENGNLIVACAQPLQITQTRGDMVVTTRTPTPSEVIYVGRSPYVAANGHWMEWNASDAAYVDTGITAKGDIGITPDFSVGTVTTLAAGSSATASITGTAEEPVLNLGIPQGAQGIQGNTGATPSLTIGTVETLGEDDQATVTITGTTNNPVLNFGIPQGRTGSASGVYATNVPMSASDSTTVYAAIAAAGKVETVAGVGVASGTKNVPLTASDLPVSSSDSTTVSATLETLPVLVVTFSSFSSLPQTVSNSKITTDMVCIHSEFGTPSVQTGDWTINTDTAGRVTVSGSIYGSTTLTLYLSKSR